MNREIAKKNLSVSMLNRSRDEFECNISPKTMAGCVVLTIFILEAAKSIALKASNEEAVVSLAVELSGAIGLLLAYFLLGVWIKQDSKTPYRIIKEVFLASAVLLFLFSLQKELFNYSEHESVPIMIAIYSFSSLAFLAASQLMLDLLKASYITKVAVVVFFFVYAMLNMILTFNINHASVYLNTTLPLVYLIMLTLVHHFSQGKVETQKRKYKINTKAPGFLELAKESVFVFDRKGNPRLVNTFCIKELHDLASDSPIELFRKIKEVKFVMEEKLEKEEDEERQQEQKHANKNHDESMENLTSNYEEDLRPDSPKSPSIVLNLEDVESVPSTARSLPVSSLDNVINVVCLKVTSKEVTDKRIYYYKARLDSEKKKKNFLEVRIFVCPKTANPITVMIRDETAQHKLNDLQTFEKIRQSVFYNLTVETNRVLDTLKALVEVSTQAINNIHSPKNRNSQGDVTTLLTQLTQQILSPILATIADIEEFCSSSKKKLKFTFSQVDLRKLIEKIVKLNYIAAKLQGVTLLCEFKGDQESKFVVFTDEKRLKQLLSKLISNSLKHTKEGTIKITVTAFKSSYNISIHDTGKGISPPSLNSITEELKVYKTDNLKIFHSKAKKSQGLPIAQMISFGLGPKSGSGLTIKSPFEQGTYVSFILENKSEEEGFEHFSSPTHMMQKKGFSPMKPSKFKMTHDYESQDVSQVSDMMNESAGIHTIVHHSLERKLSNKNLDQWSPRGRPNNQSMPDIRSHDRNKKSKFAEQLSPLTITPRHRLFNEAENENENENENEEQGREI